MSLNQWLSGDKHNKNWSEANAKSWDVELLTADEADIGTLSVVNFTGINFNSDNIDAKNVKANYLTGATGSFNNLLATGLVAYTGYISNLIVDNLIVTSSIDLPDIITANTGQFTNLYSTNGYIQNLTGLNLDYNNIEGSYLNFVSATGTRIGFTNATGSQLDCKTISCTGLTCNNIVSINITGINATFTNAYIANLTGSNLTFANSRISTLTGAFIYSSLIQSPQAGFTICSGEDLSFATGEIDELITISARITNLTGTNAGITNLSSTIITGTNIYSNLVSSALGQFTDLNGLNLLSSNANITDSTTTTNLRATTFTGTDAYIANIKSQPFFNTSGPQMKLKRVVNSFGYLIDGSLSNGTSPAADRTITFPDPGMNCDFVLSTGTQTIGGIKTFVTANTTNSTITNLSATIITGTNISVSGNLVLSSGSGNLLWYETGSFSMTGSGCCTGTYPGFKYSKLNNVVTLYIPEILDNVIASSALTLNILPSKIRPIKQNLKSYYVASNGVVANSSLTMNTGTNAGTFLISPTSAGGNFSTTCRVYGDTIVYLLD